ncbi:HNH endonuclease [Acetobacter sicerae]|nr:HNH endonuclease [Acetobacter sicerae]
MDELSDFSPTMEVEMLPETVSSFAQRSKNFRRFLEERGSQVLVSPNPYEVLRFTGPRGRSCIIYKKENGRLTWTECAREAWLAFKSQSDWRACAKTTRGRESRDAVKRRHLYAALNDRDGNCCFYCGKPVLPMEFSIEHFVPVTAGGPDHISNMAITHAHCNQRAGALSVVEKVRLSESMKCEDGAVAK